MTFHRLTHECGGGGAEEFSTRAEEKYVHQISTLEFNMRFIRAAVDE
jgi:hypothetical protein